MKLSILFGMLVFVGAVNAQVDLVSIVDLEPKLEGEPRGKVILLSAPWCKWCAKMKSEISDNKELGVFGMKYLFVYLNVESQEEIEFDDRVYHPVSNGYHELAQALNGSTDVTLPTLLVLNEKSVVIFDHKGYMDQEALLRVLRSNVK